MGRAILNPAFYDVGRNQIVCGTDLPRLWLPKREDLRVIEAIPTLGSGKVDLRAVKQLALEAVA